LQTAMNAPRAKRLHQHAAAAAAAASPVFVISRRRRKPPSADRVACSNHVVRVVPLHSILCRSLSS